MELIHVNCVTAVKLFAVCVSSSVQLCQILIHVAAWDICGALLRLHHWLLMVADPAVPGRDPGRVFGERSAIQWRDGGSNIVWSKCWMPTCMGCTTACLCLECYSACCTGGKTLC